MEQTLIQNPNYEAAFGQYSILCAKLSRQWHQDPNTSYQDQLDGLEVMEDELAYLQYEAPSWVQLKPEFVGFDHSVSEYQNLCRFRQDVDHQIEEIADRMVDPKTNAAIEDLSRLRRGYQQLLSDVDYELSGVDTTTFERESDTESDSDPKEASATEIQTSPHEAFDLDLLSERTLLTESEAAFYLGITPKTLKNRVSAKTIPSYCYRGERKHRQYYREKIDRFCISSKRGKNGTYSKINWYADVESLTKLISELEASEYISNISGLRSHFVFGSKDVSAQQPVDWIGNGPFKGTQALASLLYVLYERKAIHLDGPKNSLHIAQYIKDHFTIMGEASVRRTVQGGIGAIHLDRNDGYNPDEEMIRLVGRVITS